MYRSDIPSNFGAFVNYVKFTFNYDDLTAAATTQTISLLENPPVNTTSAFYVPQAGKVLGVCVHHTVAFAGTAITGVTVSVGNSNLGVAGFAPAFNIFQAVADTTLQETAEFKAGQITAAQPTVTFVSTGGNLSAMTAGSVDIYILFLNVSEPVTYTYGLAQGSLVSQP